MTKYYTLECSGNTVKNRSLPLVIGQCSDAGLKLPESLEWESENFVEVDFIAETESWRLVRLSQTAAIAVNGLPLDQVYYLHNCDLVEIEGSRIRFRIREDEAYSPSDGITAVPSWLKRKAWIAGAVLALLVAAVGTLAVTVDREKDVKFWNTNSLKTSILPISVDSIYVQQLQNGGYITVRALPASPGGVMAGTCFVTGDGMLVTARHCIQPWLEMAPDTDTLCCIVADAETGYLARQDSSFRVVAKVTVAGRTFLSSDFRINDSRDIVRNIGDRRHPRYWRSMTPSFHYKDCALGDIAWIPESGFKGRARLADRRMLSSLDANEPIAIIGYTKTGTGALHLNRQPGTLMNRPHLNADGAPDECLYHNDESSKGDSGAPVVIRRGKKLYVVSVMSRKDEFRDTRSSFSVPVSEIYNESE